MPTEVIDAPQTETTTATPDGKVTPSPTETTTSAKAKPGDKFRQAMGEMVPDAKQGGKKDVVTTERAETTEDKKTKTETEKKPAATDKTPAKPKALDLAIAGQDDGKKAADTAATTEDTATDTVDVLKEFDDKKPNWERARGVMKTQGDEINRLKKTLAEKDGELGKIDKATLDSLPVIVKERDELKQKNAQLLDTITALNVEYSPEYQDRFVKGRQKEIEKAITRVKEFGGDVEMFTNALELKGKAQVEALRAALADVDDMAKPRIVAILDRIQQIDEEAAEMRSKPQQSFEQLESKRAEERQRASEENAKRFDGTFEKTVAALRTKSPLLRTVDPTSEGGADWNEDVKKAIDGARAVFADNVPVERLVEVAAKGSRYDSVEKMLLDTQAENTDLRKRLREYEESTPDLSKASGRIAEKAVKKKPGTTYREALQSIQGGNVEV